MESSMFNRGLANVLNLGHYENMKAVRFHPKAIDFIRGQSDEIKKRFGEAPRDLQKGVILGMPLSRPMPSVALGVAELRVKDGRTTVRVFYITKIKDTIVVFHGFEKDTQKTPKHEIEQGRRRLKEALNGEV
jgi:phage-related protein